MFHWPSLLPPSAASSGVEMDSMLRYGNNAPHRPRWKSKKKKKRPKNTRPGRDEAQA